MKISRLLSVLALSVTLVQPAFLRPVVTYAATGPTVYVNSTLGSDSNDGLTPETAFQTLATGVASVDAGGTVFIAAGEYPLSSTLEINKPLTLSGEGEDTTIIDASTVVSYGIRTSASNITLQNFGLQGNSSGGPNSNYGIKMEGSGVVPNDHITVSHVKVVGAGGSGFDLNGINDSSFSDITAISNIKMGFALTDGKDISITNLTTIGNFWGGVSITAKGAYFPGGVDNITLSGTNSFSEAVQVYTEIDDVTYDITNLHFSTTEFPYLVRRAPANQVFYSMSEGNADTLVAFFAPDGVKESRTPVSYTSVYVSATGNDANNGTEAEPFLTIAKGIEMVDEDGTVHVGAGTFAEQLLIEKPLTLVGQGSASTLIKAPAVMTSGTYGTNVITVDTTGIVDISDLWVSGPGPGPCGSIDYGIFVGGGANAFVHGVRVTDIRDEPFSGCQNGGGIRYGSAYYGTIATGTINGNTVTGYQKGGIVVDGTGSSATVTNNAVTGIGPTLAIAQNGIQISRGATAIVSDNTISGNTWNCDCADPMNDWQSGGILIFEGGNGISITNNTITDNDYGIYNHLSGGGATTISGNTIDSNRFVGIILDDGNATIRRNHITNSGYIGVQNITSEDSFDAEENYWGSAAGPDVETEVDSQVDIEGDVTYDPWYIDAAMTRLSNAPTTTGGSGYIAPQPQPGSTPDGGTPPGAVLGDTDEQPETPPGQVLGDTDENEAEDIESGSYIRTHESDTVYFIDDARMRHPVIDAQTYFTYTDTWTDVIFVSEKVFASFPLGKPVLPKAEVVLVKIQSTNEVYALEFGANGGTVLRLVPNEMTAEYVYGEDWMDYVIDVEPTHFKRFIMGDEINARAKADLSIMKTRQELARQ